MRSLRVRGRAQIARPREASGWGEGKPCDPTLSSAAREALADVWLRAALDEHASVPAFARISTSLVALGAPRELIEACHRAALAELEHATRAFALASSYAGRTFAPGPLHALLAPERDPRVPELHLRKLAVETLEDGCLGEGVASELAREALLHATDPDVKATLAVIARDETAHHELAWRILWWCLDAGGASVREAVRDKLALLPRTIMPRRTDPRIAADMKRHGYVDADRQRAVFVEVREYTVSRATWILDGLDRRAA